jgi:hypothetical protein
VTSVAESGLAGRTLPLLWKRQPTERIRVIVTAAIPAVLYLVYVLHYSVNVPWGFDDWEIVPLVDAANHGHLSMGSLWQQYGDRRLVVGRLILVAFGVLDNLNERHVVMFTAILFVASYILFLVLLRDYLKRLTCPSVLVVGVVWFSLTDWFGVLWSFQLSWYLVIFFFVVMLVLLQKRGPVLFCLAITSAVLASLTDISGFVLWPVGLICLLWCWRRWKVAAWLAAFAVTVAVYFHNYNFGYKQCPTCTANFDIHDPVLFVKFVLGLVGGIVPAVGILGVPPIPGIPWMDGEYFGLHQLLGAAIILAAAYVVIRSVRERRRSPLPVVLIALGALFDLLIAEGRTGQGLVATVGPYYSIPNLAVLLGIVVFAWGHLPDFRTDRSWRVIASGALIVFLVAQAVVATGNGIDAGGARHQQLEADARVVANFDRLPAATRGCVLSILAGIVPSEVPDFFDPWYGMAVRDHLSFFDSSAQLRNYKGEGPLTSVSSAQFAHFAIWGSAYPSTPCH